MKIKNIWIITASITSVGAIGFATAFGFYYEKYKSLDKVTTHKFGNKSIHIISYLGDGTKSLDKIYKTTSSEDTLESLMLNHKEDFTLSGPKSFGRMLKIVNKVEADYAKNNKWWKLASKTYWEHYPQIGKFPKEDFALPYGISKIYLLNDETIRIYETAA